MAARGSSGQYLVSDYAVSRAKRRTNPAGEALSRQLYYPFGEQRWASAALPTDFAFTGQRHDPSTGLYFFHARYYHSGVGRFVSAGTIVPEPGDPQSLNRYSYVNNNPLALVDPAGHDPQFPMIEGMCGSAESCADLDPQASVFDEWWEENGWYIDWSSPDFLTYAEAAYELYSTPGTGGIRWLRDIDRGDPENAPFRTEAAWHYAYEVKGIGWTPGINVVGGAMVLGTMQAAINAADNLGMEWGSRYRATNTSGGGGAAGAAVKMGPLQRGETLYRFSNKRGRMVYSLSPKEDSMSFARAKMFSSPEAAYEAIIGEPPVPGTHFYQITTAGALADNGFYPIYDGGRFGNPIGHISVYSGVGVRWGNLLQSVLNGFSSPIPFQ